VPLYEYECAKCHKRTEKIEHVSGPHLKKCPHCGGKVEQLLTAPAIQFKGSGWYVTDYAGKKSGTAETAPTKESGGKDSSTESAAKDSSKESSSKESTKESSTKEKKPVKK
jgi:putative FmdB family regulatory protein